MSSNTIHSFGGYKELKALLIAEGSLDRPLRTGYGESESRPYSVVLSSISQVFVVDFSQVILPLAFFGHDRKMRSTRIYCFRNPQKRTEALYQGAEVLFCFDCIPLTPCTGDALSYESSHMILR